MKKYNYRAAHCLVKSMALLELGNGKHTQEIGAPNLSHFRFTVTGTSTDTGLRDVFQFAIVSRLTPSERGALDLPYVLKTLDETVEGVMASYGYFVTGNAPRGGQVTRAFERFILSPSSVVTDVPNVGRLVFEGKGSIFTATAAELESDKFKQRTENRPYVVISERKVFPYICEAVPKWGHDELTLVTDPALFGPEVIEALREHFQKSAVLPGDRSYPAIILAQEENGAGRIAGRIDSPGKKEFVLKRREPTPPGTRPVSKIEKAAIPSNRLSDEEMALWGQGVKENDQIMGSPRPVRTPWKMARAAG